MGALKQEQDVVFQRNQTCVFFIENKQRAWAIDIGAGIDNDTPSFRQEALDQLVVRLSFCHIIANCDGHFPSYRNSVLRDTQALGKDATAQDGLKMSSRFWAGYSECRLAVDLRECLAHAVGIVVVRFELQYLL